MIEQDSYFKKYAYGKSIKHIQNVNQYRLVEDAYSGSGGIRDGSYLIEHDRESDFLNRVGYSFYLNFFKPIIEALVLPCFQRPPERINNSKDKEWEKFEQDCNARGDSLNIFMRNTALIAKRDGVAFIVMDNFRQVPLSQGESLEKRLLPYVYIKKAGECVYYKVDEFGRLLEIAFYENAGQTTKNKEELKNIRLWTKDGWVLYSNFNPQDETFEGQIDSGPNLIGILPIIPVYTTEADNNKVLPTPPLYDIARINIAIYNVWSEAREIMRKIAFPFLALPMDRGTGSQDIVLGAGNILGFPMASSREPKFLSPDVEIIQIYIDTANALREEAYRQAKINGVTGIIQNSGKAKEWDFQATKTELSNLSNTLEDAEQKLVDMFGKWTNKKIDVSIEYINDFGVMDLLGDIDKTERLLDLDLPIEIKKEVKKDLVSGVFSKKMPEDRAELIKTIDNQVQDQKKSTENVIEEPDSSDNR